MSERGKEVRAAGGESRLGIVRYLIRSPRECGRFFVLGLSVLLGMLLAERGIAQTQTGRLSVRPHEVTGTTRTARAGDVLLDSLPDYSLYVPQACTRMGKSRCPLVVAVSDIPPAGSVMPQTALGWQRPVADKYGLIVLVLHPYLPVRMDGAVHEMTTDIFGGSTSDTTLISGGQDLGRDTRRLDAALTQVLQQFPVDPGRIALLGYRSFTAAQSPKVLRNVWPWAVQNPGVFSRVVMSATIENDLALPPAAPTRPTRFLLATEVLSDDGPIAFGFAQALRRQGYPAELLLSLKSGGRGVWEELDFIGRWLQNSWATPNAAARSSATAGTVDSLPLLTTEALSHLAQFWVSFQQEPDSIRRWGRRAYLREIVLPIDTGAACPRTWLTDMAALAAQYPSVAAKLKAAGLTAEEHDMYRLALLSARFVHAFGDSAAAAAGATAVVAKNAAFLEAHRDDEALNQVLDSEGLKPAAENWLVAGMWQMP